MNEVTRQNSLVLVVSHRGTGNVTLLHVHGTILHISHHLSVELLLRHILWHAGSHLSQQFLLLVLS